MANNKTLEEANLIANSDIKLVEHFASCIRAQKLRAISDSISPNFVYSSPRVKALNFEQFCNHYEEWSLYAEVQFINVEQYGDKYIVDQVIQFIDNQRNYFELVKRKMTVTVSDHLIETVKVEYEPSPEEKTYMDLAVPIPEQFKP